MKKFFTLLVSVALMFSLFSCVRPDLSPAPSPTASVTKAPEMGKTELSEGVFQLALPFRLTDCTDMLISGKYLIASGTEESWGVGLFVCDMSTGLEAARWKLCSGELTGFDAGGFGCLASDGSVYASASPTEEPKRINMSNSELSLHFLPDGSLYCAEDAKLSLFKNDGGSKFTLDLSASLDFLSVRYMDGGYIYATAGLYGQEASMLKIDAAIGEYENIGATKLGSGFMSTRSMLISKSDASNTISAHLLSSPLGSEAFSITTASRLETLLDASDEYVATLYAGLSDTMVGIYGADGSLYYFASPAGNPDESICAHQLDAFGLYLLYRDNVKGGTRLLLVAVSDLTAIERPEIDDPSQRKFGDGVTVLTGEAAVLDFGSFAALPLEDEDKIQLSSEIAAETLADFPAGFFDELLLGGKAFRRSLVVCITGRLIPFSSESIDFPGGYTCADSYAYYVVIDATYDFNVRPSLCHELMHVIDMYLSEVSESPYPDWDKYVPENSYFNSYRAPDGSEINDFQYTDVGYKNIYDVWFPTSYCRTYAIEDRAVMFSLMFDHNPYYINFPHILDRMNLLARTLRDNFGSVRNAEAVIWEQNI